jgi:hypothetical protein
MEPEKNLHFHLHSGFEGSFGITSFMGFAHLSIPFWDSLTAKAVYCSPINNPDLVYGHGLLSLITSILHFLILTEEH